jgi:hypothetical protein
MLVFFVKQELPEGQGAQQNRGLIFEFQFFCHLNISKFKSLKNNIKNLKLYYGLNVGAQRLISINFYTPSLSNMLGY